MNHDVAVVGAGMTGATLACALAKAGLRVAVIEAGDPPPPPGDTWELRVSAIADEMCTSLASRREADFVTDYAFPFPALVIGELLGVRVQDREQFRQWSTLIVNALGGGDLDDRLRVDRGLRDRLRLDRRGLERQLWSGGGGGGGRQLGLGRCVNVSVKTPDRTVIRSCV